MREIEQVKRQSKQLNSQPLCPFRVVQRDAGIAWVRACHKGGTRASLHMGGNDFGQIQVLAVDGAAAVPAVGSEGVYISSGAGHGVSVHHFHGGLAHVACDEVKHFLPQQWRLVGKLNHVACIGEGMDGFVAQLSVGGVRFFKGFIGREWGLFGYALFYRGRNGKASF